jgi:deoxycytidine triphosphate deaminase
MVGVFSDKDILRGIEEGHIIVYPLNKKNLAGASLDVTLGEWFYVTDKIENQIAYNPFDESDVKRYFGEPKRALPHKEWSAKHKGLKFKGIPENHPIIVLQPRERILAHTQEFIGINPPGTTQMQARSTWGRNGIVVCKDAGWGDPGYINRWTMEIQNDNDESVPLPVGERIAQIVFLQTGEVDYHYGTGGKYQGGKTLKQLIKAWKPEMMLPRAYKDKRTLPMPL